jgi:hypothetical protein
MRVIDIETTAVSTAKQRRHLPPLVEVERPERNIPQADIAIAQLAPTFAMPAMSENGVSASVDQMSIFGHFYFIVGRCSCRRRRCAGRRCAERSVGRDRGHG